METITFDDFMKLDLRVGKILSVEDHPQADKLYVLKVDIGEKEIQLVAGIKLHYQPQELVGKLVSVIVNLEPKPLRGVESQGMLLAASSADKSVVTILTPEQPVPAGSTIG